MKEMGFVRSLASWPSRCIEALKPAIYLEDISIATIQTWPCSLISVQPFSEEDRRAIYQQSQRGVNIALLAKRYGEPAAVWCGSSNEQRAQRLFELPLDYIPNVDFDKKSLVAEILGDMPAAATSRKVRAPAACLPIWLPLYDVPLLTRETGVPPVPQDELLEASCKKLLSQLDPQAPKIGLMEQIEELIEKVWKSRIRSYKRTCDWWFRSPSDMLEVAKTSSP